MPNKIEQGPYGLSPEEHEYLPKPIFYSDEPVPRRSAMRVLMGGAIALAGGGTLIGSSILMESPPIPQKEDEASEDHLEPIDIAEPIVRSFIEHSRVYVNRDEILARAMLSPEFTFGFSITGSDAVQLYELNDQRPALLTGSQVVKRDGLEFVRFTLRPSEYPQHLHSTIRDANNEIIEDVTEELPQVFTSFPQPGRIALYHENELKDSATVAEIHEYANRFEFLFPELPPFLTVRAPDYDEITSYGVYPTNFRVISPEIPVTEDDATTTQNDNTQFGWILKLVDVYQRRITSLNSNSTEIPAEEFEPLKKLQDSIGSAYLQDKKINPQLPEYWPSSVEQSLQNFIFHAGTYSNQIDNSTIYAIYPVSSTESILTTLLFLSQDEERTHELHRRILSLDRMRRKDVTPSDSHYDEIRRIIRDATRVLQTTDEAGVRDNLPRLLALYDELDLDSETLNPDIYTPHPY